MVSIYIILLFLGILLYWKKSEKPKKYKFPDGPRGVPIIGNLLQLIASPHLQLSKWAYKYGNMYTLNILGYPALVLNNAEKMKQVLGTMESTGKYDFFTLTELGGGVSGRGIISVEGKKWQEMRTFLVKSLKDCGTSRRSVVEPTVIQEGQRLMKWIETEAGKNDTGVVSGFREACIQTVSSFTWNILNRQTDGSSSSEIGKLARKYIEMLNVTINSGLLFLPWLKHVAPNWSGYTGLAAACKNIRDKIQSYFDLRIVERQKGTIEPENRNLLDAYLDQWENCKEDEKSCFFGEEGWKQAFYSVVHVLIAAADTQAATLNWALNYLVANPKVQQKLFEELNEVLGKDTIISLTDKPKLPYLNAVIQETLRMSSVIPMGIVHRLLEDTQVDNYLIPKDTLLIANIYHANTDKSVWQDADVFRPERFLENNILKDNITSFQPGKRVCPGEKLSKDALFIFIGMLVQKFKLGPASGKKAFEYAKPIPGYMLYPAAIGFQVEARL